MSENNVNSTEEIVLSVEMGDAVSAQTAEAYAVGKRGGVDVAETDPTWHNNAKYYAEQAEEAAGEAQGAEEAAQRAETAQAAAEAARDRAEAIGAGAAQSAAAAAESAQAAATAKTGAETAQSAAAGSATAAEGSAGRASQSATAAAGSATAAGTAKTAAETARDAAAGSATAAAGSATAADQSAQAAAASAQAAEDVAESIPADYSQLSADVTGLKSAFDANSVVINGIKTASGFEAPYAIIYNTGIKAKVSNPSMTASDFVEIPDGANTLYCTMLVVSSYSNRGIAFYSDKNEESYLIGYKENVSTDAGFEIRSFNIPSTAKYVRFSYLLNDGTASYVPFYVYTDKALQEQIFSIDKKVDEAIVHTENVLPFNLFNVSDPDIIVGKKIDYNGNLADNNALCVSGFIPVVKGHTYTFPVYTNHFGTGSGATYIGGYDKNKNWLRAQSGTLNGSILTVTLSQNYEFAYIRVNVSVQNANSNYLLTPYHSHDNFMVVEGTSLPDRYIPFTQQKLMDTNVYSAHENLDNPLYGSKVAFLGDSICEGGDDSGYCSRIGLRNTMLWENAGIGVSTIAITSANKTICTRPITMENPEYLILEGGTNDADRIGDATGETKPAAFGTWNEDDYGTNDSSSYYGFDINTFCGAVDYMCKRMVSDYPYSKIGFIGAHKMGTTEAARKNRGYYIHEAMKICRKWGIPCLNLWDESHLNPMIPSQYTNGEDFLYVDGQHLTHKGYDYISPVIANWMKTL